MTCAEIIAIGTELLLGEIVDTNTSVIAKEFNKIGIDIHQTSVIGDNRSRIAGLIRQALNRANIIITTGGLGPTVDDPTRIAVAEAFDKDLIFHEDLWDQIRSRFRAFNKIPTENNKKQAFIPEGAIPIENTVGTAPAFLISENKKSVICLPGVPAEMVFLLRERVVPLLIEMYHLNSTITSRIIHTAGIGESTIDDLICELENLENPSVGITAKPGQVDIRITAKARNETLAKEMINPIENLVMEKIGSSVYGFDEDELQKVVSKMAENLDLKISLIHNTDNHDLISNLYRLGIFHEITKFQTNTQKENELNDSLYNNLQNPEMIVQMRIFSKKRQDIKVKIFHLGKSHTRNLRFGGYTTLFNTWIENNLLNFIREVIIQGR